VAALSESAFGELHREAARPLWAYVYRVTGNAADADDIVQEAFCRVLVADVGHLAAEDLRRYLFRVASNLVADRWRRASRERSSLEQVARGTPATTRPASVDDHELTQTFARLKPRDRQLLWLAYVEDQDHGQMAGALGVSRASVKVLLSRAKSRLRDLLKVARAVSVL
jgi:RNA polymerase sigma-70 factor (ECF subfamily)